MMRRQQGMATNLTVNTGQRAAPLPARRGETRDNIKQRSLEELELLYQKRFQDWKD